MTCDLQDLPGYDLFTSPPPPTKEQTKQQNPPPHAATVTWPPHQLTSEVSFADGLSDFQVLPGYDPPSGLELLKADCSKAAPLFGDWSGQAGAQPIRILQVMLLHIRHYQYQSHSHRTTTATPATTKPPSKWTTENKKKPPPKKKQEHRKSAIKALQNNLAGWPEKASYRKWYPQLSSLLRKALPS